jgi:hypothetical protein
MFAAVALSTLLYAVLTPTPDGGPSPGADARGLELRLDDRDAEAGPTLALAAALVAPEEALGGTGPGAPRLDGARVPKLQWWGRTLRWSTAASLVVTSTLGTMAAINQPTAFGDGRCITGNPVLGDYGCNRGLSTLHGSSAVLSVTLYTANAVLGLAAPESRGYVAESVRPLHGVLTWVHLGGIVVQPVLGIVAAFPQVIGKSNTVPTDSFPKNLRTVHIFVGYVTTLAFLTTTALER